jgi:hypothetical protein
MSPAVSLLCPVQFHSFIIVTLFIFLVTGVVMPLALGYRILWGMMYHPGPLLGDGKRLQGRVTGTPPPGTLVFGRDAAGRQVAEPFILMAGETTVLVDPRFSQLKGWPQRICVGDRVTVDGFSDSVPVSGERLYRQNHTEPGLFAVQIARGTLPGLCVLTRTLSALWLSSMLVLLVVLLLC